MSKIAFTTIKELKAKLDSKELSPREVCDLTVERISKIDASLNSVIETFSTDSVLDEIASVDTSASLWGVPGLIKDIICQKNRITSCASAILKDFTSPFDATAISWLKDAGALCMGRANCDEFAMGTSNETSVYGRVANPWDLTRVPGGSSGGSAAAVAAGLVPWALGTETGGSVRQPAALCGIVGLKPTYGRVSRYGLVAYTSSVDQIGVLTRTVYDNALVFSAIAGHDERDSTSLNVARDDYTENLSPKLRGGLKIGVIENAINAPGIDSEIHSLLTEALAEYERLGAELVPLKLPLMDFGAAVYFMVSRAEAASNLARFDGVRYGYRDKEAESLEAMYAKTRARGFGRVVKERIIIGNYVLSAGHADEYYKRAKHVQSLMREQFLEAFKSVDVLFAPVSPIPAFKFDAFGVDSLAMDLQDYFTCPANLTGLPALAVPCGFTKAKLPTAFQLYGPDLSEKLLFETGYAYEQATPWHTKHPDLP